MNTRSVSGSELLSFDPYRIALSNYRKGSSFDWEAQRNKALMEFTVMYAGMGYTCLRPPGPAGALFCDIGDAFILGCAEPPTGPTCEGLGLCEIEDGHCVRTIHAEVNAILHAAKYGYPTDGGTLYSILKPCYQCAKVIIAAGIMAVFYAGAAYDEPRTRLLFQHAGVLVQKIDVGLPYAQSD